MRIARFYCPTALNVDTPLTLPEATFHHAVQVLRLGVGEPLILFNGTEPVDYYATLTEITRRSANAHIMRAEPVERESTRHISLALALIKPDKMDFALQKAVELGVTQLQPLFTERSVIRVIKDKQDKKLQHWQGILISACEQSGRTQLPLLAEPISLSDYIAQQSEHTRIMLAPGAYPRLGTQTLPSGIELIIGPEGGFSDDEIELCQQANILMASLGPRILRAETACISALTLIQHHYGDL